MSDISNQLIKHSYNYVLQSDIGTGIVYRIGGAIPVNPIFQSGLTVTGGFTYSGAGEQVGYALLTDGTGYAYWGPISAATPSSGVTSITVGDGLSANSSTGAVTIVFTGSTGLSGEYLPLSGGTVTGDTIFTSGVSVNTLTANTSNFDSLYVSNFTEVHYLDVFDISNFYSTANFFQDITVSGTVYSDTVSATTYLNYPDSYVTGFTSNGNQLTITQNRSDTYSALTLTLTGITATTTVVQGITGITGTSGVSASTNDYGTVIINTDPDKTVVITGGTGIQIISNYPNFGINYTGSTGTSGDYLPLSGGTVTGGTVFTNGLTANTISATTYYNLPKDVFVTGGTYANGTATFTNNTGGTFNVVGFPTATGTTTNYYGSFTDTNTQPVNGANTPTAWSANTTELSNGIYIVDGSKITVSNDGVYEIGYSAQIEKTQGVGANVTIWAKINGNNVDRSSSTITLENNSVYSLPFVSYIFDLYAGDQVEFYFSSPSDHVQITTLSGLTSPTRPVSPSLILVAKAIGNAVLSNSGDSYVTGFTLTNDNLTLSQNRVGQYSGFSVNLPYLNTSGGTITGNLNVTGSVTASTYYGYGGYLTGISRGGGGGAGGQLYYFNISNTQTPYYEFSTTATTASEQTISATTGASQTAYIGGFMTPSGSPGITNFPAGILSFYLHAYDETNYNFNIYCQLYKRTSGGTETLLFNSDPVAVVGDTPTMVISDGYFSGATLDVTDRLVAKVYATNISNQTRTIYFVSEGSDHYSFALTTIPTFTDTYVTGFTYSNNTFTIKQNNNQPDLSQTINTMTGLTVNGNLVSTTISATTYQNLPVSGLSGGNNISVTGSNGNFTISFTGTTGSNFTGGTVSGATIFTDGLTANTISATTYYNLPVSAVTSGDGISASTSDGTVTIVNTRPQGITGITATDGLSGNTSSFFTTIINTDKGSSQNIFKNIQIGGIFQFSASTNNSNLNFSGIGLTITSGSNNTLVFSASPGGVTSITVGSGLSASSTTGDVSIINTQTQGITGVTAGYGISANTTNNVTTIIQVFDYGKAYTTGNNLNFL